MRRLLVAVPLLLFAAVASAQSTTTPWRLTVFASDVGVTSSTSAGTDVTGGLGFGLAYAPNERWSAEFAVTAQRYKATFTEFRPVVAPHGASFIAPYTTYRNFTSFPLTATGRYHFANRSRWTPFLLGGVRHVQAPEYGSTIVAPFPAVSPYVLVTEGFRLEDRTSAEAGGGVVLELTERVGLQLEGRHLLREDGAPHDPLTRFSVGVSWKF